MTRPMSLPALSMIAACALPVIGHSQADKAWPHGSFTGVFDKMQVTLTCDSLRACEYTFGPGDAAVQPVLRRRARDIAPVDAQVANNNLTYTREAVQADPALYTGREGPVLADLRPVLESQARYRQCVSTADGDWGPLCQLDITKPGLPDAVLLVPTMNPTCNGQAFCAYYAVPLRRQTGG
ncbi:hypothetical protein ACG02S_23230 [Roseateles sp. DC23W]|uniref:Uncharacterized protein n=1 Tax=Pelomonas dachongensis TaxID=3299029 RepID=A0ABW7ETQ0_9BURK